MFIGYIDHRNKLGFSYIKDLDSIEKLLDVTTTLKNSLIIFVLSKRIIVKTI